MRVLLVEDSPTQAKVTTMGLESRNNVVYPVPTLEGARDVLEEKKVDVILLDLSLPGSSGIETVRFVRGLTNKVPIVVFTSEDDNELALEALKNGAQDYIVKGAASDDMIVRSLNYAIERNVIELKLRNEEKRLQAILQNSYDAFFSMDSTWRITDLNPAAETMFGWTRVDAIGQNFASLIPHHLRRQYMRVIAECFANKDENILKTSKELTSMHRDGHEFPIEIGIFRIKEDHDYLFCAFARDLTEQKKSNDELETLVRSRTSELVRSNEELRQFAKIASHDLQEPLRAVEGFATLLAETAAGKLEKDQLEFIDYILDGTKRMQHLIRAVLVHSEIEKSVPGEQTTDCEQVITEVLKNLKSSIRDTEATFDIGDLPEVRVEHTLMVQLFQNLVSNAIKYRGKNKPYIAIRAEENLNQWMFSVRDDGIGIDPRYSDTVFDMFARLHSKSEYPGTGMGLAICKKIVTSHGGNIWVESKPGEGSIFMFTLPATKKQGEKAKMKDHMEILLVEDTPSDVSLTQEALKRADLKYELNIVNDGVEAMDYLHQLKASGKRLPDAILLDLNMPKKNGHQVLEEIEADSILKPIPVILVTVSERDEDVLDALKSKMNYYVAKPITSQKLSVLLKSIHELHNQPDGQKPAPTDEEAHVRLILASNPHTSGVALDKLGNDPSEKVRVRVAENPQSSAELLTKLSSDESAEVRLSVGENPSAPEAVLLTLAKDPSDDVRLGLASSQNTPKKILEKLTSDENIYVSSNASKTLGAKSGSTP